MVGGVGEGFATYLKILNHVREHKMVRAELVLWLKTEFQLAQSYAKNVADLLLFGPGLIQSQDNGCVLTDAGAQILNEAKPNFLYDVFARQFVGITDIVEILHLSQPLTWEKLFDLWRVRVSKTSPEVAKWKVSHAKMQFRHRLDWLRSLTRQ